MTESDSLRARLIELRRDVLGVLQRDGTALGELALLASVQGALAAIEADAAADAAAPEPSGRVVLTDDGSAIRLISYADAERAAVVELSPRRAIALAGDLIAAALPRLSR
jgi:hypothetical protein